MSRVIELKDDSNCFVCGKSNVYGLQLNWNTEGYETSAEFFPARSHQGWQGVVHGGILAAVLDEAMTRLTWQKYGNAVTGEMTVRYSNPARIGEKLLITGSVEQGKGRLIPAKAEIRNTDGMLIASATAKTVRMAEQVA